MIAKKLRAPSAAAWRVATAQWLASSFFFWRDHLRLPIGLFVLGFVTLALAVLFPNFFDRTTRLIERIASKVAVLVTKASVALIGIPLLALGWLWHKLVGTSALSTQQQRWMPAVVSVADRSRYTSVILPALLIAGAAAVGFAAWRSADDDSSSSDEVSNQNEAVVSTETLPTDTPPDSPTWTGVPTVLTEIEDQGVRVHDPVVGPYIVEWSSDAINVAGGVRASYESPDPAMEVWFFGGADVFGLDVADEDTIPSLVVKAAERVGVSIKALNFAVPTANNWVSTERFEQEITLRPPPDLVVFIDGREEYATAAYAAELGVEDINAVMRLPSHQREVEAMAIVAAALDDNEVDQEEMVDRAANQYGRGVELAMAYSKEFGFPVLHYWQPAIPGTPAEYESIRVDSGAEPIVLSELLEEVVLDPFYENQHLTAAGAEVMADAIYPSLKATLDGLGNSR